MLNTQDQLCLGRIITVTDKQWLKSPRHWIQEIPEAYSTFQPVFCSVRRIGEQKTHQRAFGNTTTSDTPVHLDLSIATVIGSWRTNKIWRGSISHGTNIWDEIMYPRSQRGTVLGGSASELGLCSMAWVPWSSHRCYWPVTICISGDHLHSTAFPVTICSLSCVHAALQHPKDWTLQQYPWILLQIILDNLKIVQDYLEEHSWIFRLMIWPQWYHDINSIEHWWDREKRLIRTQHPTSTNTKEMELYCYTWRSSRDSRRHSTSLHRSSVHFWNRCQVGLHLDGLEAFSIRHKYPITFCMQIINKNKRTFNSVICNVFFI